MTEAANGELDLDDLRDHHVIVAWDALAPDELEWIGEPGEMLGLTISLEDGRWIAVSTQTLAEAGREIDHERPIEDVRLSLWLRHTAYASPNDAARAAGWYE